MDITKINKIPRNIFVFITAKISNPLESFIANIWVIVKIIPTKIAKISREKTPIDEEITKNQKENPAVTASALMRLDEAFILNWINECY